MIYTTPAVVAQRKAIVEKLLRQPYGEDLAERLSERLPESLYGLSEDDQEYTRVWASDADAALSVATGQFDGDNYDTSGGTCWVRVVAANVFDPGDSAETTITIDPPEPDCARGHAHDWQTPHSIVGGMEENPGVWGNGGGIIMNFVCRHCGARKTIDTWAQDPTTGEQGLTSVSYARSTADTRAWVKSMDRAEQFEEVEDLLSDIISVRRSASHVAITEADDEDEEDEHEDLLAEINDALEGQYVAKWTGDDLDISIDRA